MEAAARAGRKYTIFIHTKHRLRKESTHITHPGPRRVAPRREGKKRGGPAQPAGNEGFILYNTLGKEESVHIRIGVERIRSSSERKRGRGGGKRSPEATPLPGGPRRMAQSSKFFMANTHRGRDCTSRKERRLLVGLVKRVAGWGGENKNQAERTTEKAAEG